uniref:Uncharacterized protein n=1 Tax=Arundo donax TaxID=35708 RepID=A0A0A9AHD1_ARUDO
MKVKNRVTKLKCTVYF